ncbi:MAG: tetratricopeptide repeat protein [Bacteroidales bacterium]|nr:tetratricopeptide repeat protein [Bacteroidales bacterium]
MKCLNTYLLLLLILMAPAALSQEAMDFNGETQAYQKALDLYDKEKYAAAQEQFEMALEQLGESERGLKANARYYMAICAMELFHADAEYLLDRFISQYPENARVNTAYFQMGKYQYRQENYHKAVHWFDEVKRDKLSGEQQGEYFFKKGYSHYQEGELEEASQAFYEVKDRSTTFSNPALYYYSHIAYEQENHQTALEGFRQLRENSTFAPIMPYYITQIYYLQEKFQKVTEYAPQFVHSASARRLPEIARIIGDSYYQRKQYDSSLTYLKLHENKASRLARDDHYQLGYVAYKLDSLDKAITHLEQVTDKEDEMAQNAYYHLADCYLRKDQKNKAKLAFEFASKLDFDPQIQENALFNFAKITFQLRNSPFNDAIKAFKHYIDRYPDSENTTQAYNYLVKAYLNSNNYRAALQSLEELDELDVPLQKAYQKVAYYRGLELYNNRRYEEAIQAFNKSLGYSGNDQGTAARSKYWKGESYFQMQQFEKATGSYNQFLLTSGAFNSDLYERAHYNLGYAHYKLRDYQEAIKWYRKYVNFEKDPNSEYLADAFNRLGDCYFIRRSYWQAIDYYDRAIELDLRDQDYALFQRGFALGLLSRPQKKINALERLTNQYPESGYMDDAWFELGRSYMSLDQQKQAIGYFSRVVDDYPSSSYSKRALVQLGLIHYNLDNNQQAMQYYKRVVDDYPNTEEAQDALTGLKNIYVDMNRVDEYFNYVNGLGDFARVSINEQDSLTYMAAENLYMEQDCESATEFFRKYLKKFPNGSFTVNAHFYLADCLDRNDRPDQALEHYNEVIDQRQNSFMEQAWTGASRILMDREAYEKALEHLRPLEKIAEVHRNLIFARVGQMRCCHELKRPDCVLEMADKVLHTDKINAREEREAHYMKANALFNKQQFDLSLDEFKTIADEVNSKEGAEAKFRIAQIYYKKEEYKVAENEIFDFVQQNSSQEYWKARSFILLADVYKATGDIFQASHTLKSILENYQPVSEQDDVLSIAGEKYKQIRKEEEEQARPDTGEQQIKIRLKENLPDTTGSQSGVPDQTNPSGLKDGSAQEKESDNPAGDSGSNDPAGQNGDNDMSNEATSKKRK